MTSLVKHSAVMHSFLLKSLTGWLAYELTKIAELHFGQNDTLVGTLWPKWHFGQSDHLARDTLARETLWPVILWPKCHSAVLTSNSPSNSLEVLGQDSVNLKIRHMYIKLDRHVFLTQHQSKEWQVCNYVQYSIGM